MICDGIPWEAATLGTNIVTGCFVRTQGIKLVFDDGLFLVARVVRDY